MSLNSKRYWLAIISLLLSISVKAQDREIITIEYAGTGYTDPAIEEGAKVFLRDKSQQVHFTHKGIEMWCDKAIYYEEEDFIEAFSNVVVRQGDSINMNANYAEYSGITQLAMASGEVVLTEPQSVLTTDTLYFNRVTQQAFYKTRGKVVRDSSGTITSQIGRYYINSKKYQFIDNVVLVNPEYTLNTDRLDFFTETGFAFLFGPSTIVGETSKVYTERGFYDTNNDIGHFQRNARIDYDNRTIEGDSLFFDRARNFASATNNITVTDTINNSVVKGHYAEVWREKDSVFITKRAVAITVQEKDSVYIHADTLMLTGREDNRITRAYYNVRLFKSDLAGKSDSIHVNHKTGLTQMINLSRFGSTDAFATARKPVLWNMGNQMTGDTIHLISNVQTEKLDSLKVFNNAFLVSKDSLSADGYNQIKGQRLIGLFRDNELYNVDIIKNAEVIYYSRNAENELVGINKSKSGSINIQISDQAIQEIRLINQVDGELYPESLFPKSGKRLRGFDWRGDEKPNSVEDLFIGDPPLNLPIISGLKAYVPPESFIDKDTSKRIEKAGEATPEKVNKAARNLPQNESDKSSRTLIQKKLNSNNEDSTKTINKIKQSDSNKKNQIP